MRLRLRGEMRLFEERDLERILTDALDVLRQVPFQVQGTEEFFDRLTDFGCCVDGERVSFPQPVVDKVMDRCAAERQAARKAREGRTERPWPSPEVSTFTHGQALHICDPEDNTLRPATRADLAAWCHVVDALGIPSRSHPTFIPTDVPVGSSDFHAFATIILNSTRAHAVSVYGAPMLPFFIEACRVVKGSLEAVKADPVFVAKAWVTSPFRLDRENLDVAMEARRLLGTPVTFGHMPVAGASTPVTVAGALVQNTAESLALSAMRLAVDDLPQPIAGSQAFMDMRHAAPRQTGPDMLLHRLAGNEMDAYLYRGTIETQATGWCGTGASVVSPQALYEKALGMGFGVALGARHLGVGCLAFSDVGSPVQLLLDLETARHFQEMLREVVVDEAHIGLDTILATAPQGGRYLESEHTARFFREACWLPNFVDFRAFLAWVHDPARMIERAAAEARELLVSAENQCPLSDGQRREIARLMDEADAVAGSAAG